MPRAQFITKQTRETTVSGHLHDVGPAIMKSLGFEEIDSGHSYKSAMACERCARRKLPCVIPPLWLPRRVRPKSEGDMILYNRPVCRACQGRPCTLSTTGRTQKNIFWTEWALPSGHKTLTMVQASDGKVRPVSEGAVMEFAGPTSVGDLRALHEKEDQGSENDTLSEKLKDWAARTASEGTRSKTVGRKRVGDTDPYRTGSKVPGFRTGQTAPSTFFPE